MARRSRGSSAARADNGIGIFGIAPGADSSWPLKPARPRPLAPQRPCAVAGACRGSQCGHRGPRAAPQFESGGPAGPAVGDDSSPTAVAGGITVVAAALEEGEQAPGFPASLEAVIAVVASDPQGRVRGTGGDEADAAAGGPRHRDPDHRTPPGLRLPLRQLTGRRACLRDRRPLVGGGAAALPSAGVCPPARVHTADRGGKRHAPGGHRPGGCLHRGGEAVGAAGLSLTPGKTFHHGRTTSSPARQATRKKFRGSIEPFAQPRGITV